MVSLLSVVVVLPVAYGPPARLSIAFNLPGGNPMREKGPFGPSPQALRSSHVPVSIHCPQEQVPTERSPGRSASTFTRQCSPYFWTHSHVASGWFTVRGASPVVVV